MNDEIYEYDGPGLPFTGRGICDVVSTIKKNLLLRKQTGPCYYKFQGVWIKIGPVCDIERLIRNWEIAHALGMDEVSNKDLTADAAVMERYEATFKGGN